MAMFTAGSRAIDTVARTVQELGTPSPVALSETEALVLEYLLAHRDRMVPRRELLTEVWGYSESAQSRTVDTTLARLRKKLEPTPSEPRFLRTRRGQGIQLRGVTVGTEANPFRVRVSYPVGPRLFGRDAVVEQLLAGADRAGITTLVGPVGEGRASVGLDLLRRWDDGHRSAVFADLATCEDALEARDRIARALGSPKDDPDTLTDVLSGLIQPLLVIANVDAVEVSPLVARLGAVAAVVCTAITPPQTGDVVRLGPLDRDAAEAMLREHCDRTGFSPTKDVVDAALDIAPGWPLGIALIAPTLELLGTDITTWGTDLEGVDRRGNPITIRSVFEQSFERLKPLEQQVLLACAVFQDRFDVRAASAVCNLPVPQLLPALAGLRDASLVTGEAGWTRLAPQLRHPALDRLGDARAEHIARLADAFCDWREELLGDPHRATVYRHDLLRMLPSVKPSQWAPLLEVVFIAACRGGWASEAHRALHAIVPPQGESGDLFRAILAHLDYLVEDTIPDPPDGLPPQTHRAKVAYALRVALSTGHGPRTVAEAEDPRLTFLKREPFPSDPMEVWALQSVIAEMLHSPEARPSLEHMVALADERHWHAIHQTSLALLALNVAEQGDVEHALSLLDVVRTRAADLEDDLLHEPRVRVGVLLLGARLDELETELRQLRERATARGLRMTADACTLQIALLRWIEGDEEAALAELDAGPLNPTVRELADALHARLTGGPPPTHGAVATLLEAIHAGEHPTAQPDAERLFAIGLRRHGWP